ncbi:MAG: MFS transporter [Candidatus Bathyarchaeota archaeon]|jgi:MFS family permease
MISKALTKIREEFSFVRGNLLVLIVSYALFRFTYSMHYSFESLYIRELGASPFIIGLMNSLGWTILALVRIPGSYIADRYGRKKIITVFTYGVATAFLFYVFANDWRLILLGLIISNLCHVYQPALEAIEADSISPDKRGAGYSAINVLPMLPALLAPIIGGYLVERMGLVSGMKVAYSVAFAVGLVIAILRSSFLEETLDENQKIRLEELALGVKGSISSIVEAWKSMSKDVFFYALAYLISALEAPLWHIYMALYANDIIGVRGLQWSAMDTVWMFTTIIVGMPLGRLIDSIGRKKSLFLAYLLSTPIIIFFILSRGFIQLLMVMIIFAAGQAIMFPAFMALQADLVPQEKRGRIMGTMGTMRILAMVLSSAIFGYLYEADPVLPFILAVGIELITLVIFLLKVNEPEVDGPRGGA